MNGTASPAAIPYSPDELDAALRAIGAERYHHLHPFHRALHGGGLQRFQVQARALNRYYYQSRIPAKDATLLARLPTPALRRAWRSRLVDHDGGRPDDRADDRTDLGGVERWLKLTDGLGLDRDYVVSLEGVLPATRFAVDAYVAFVHDRPVLDAIASSLTELFSPQVIGERVSGMLQHYGFVRSDLLTYFTARPEQARRDSDFALAYVREHAVTPEQQRGALDALRFKCGVLWAMLDALEHAYLSPGRVPPGAFQP